MDTLPTIILKPGEADRVLGGHPWVYDSSVIRAVTPPVDGELVQVKDHRQRTIGVGFYNSASRIRVRIISPDKVTVNQAFFEHRIRAALELRHRSLPGAQSFRLINAESDILSGLIVDKYDDVLVLQTSSLGMDRRKSMIVDALRAVLAPRAILERNDIASRKFEGLPEVSGTLWGEAPESVVIDLNGLKFTAPVGGGHKTGIYLDQQLNYALVAQRAKEARVLDCFSFLGGFALHAARAGAREVHGLDQSAGAVAAATANAQANGLAERCTFETANVFDWFKAKTFTPPHERLVPQYDLIVLDPPSFTRNRASVPDALRGYKEIHVRALKLLKPGGTLATFCCSHHVDGRVFEDVIMAAAFDQRRLLRRVATYTQSPDHPILPAIPETEYLKGFAYELVRS